MSLILGQSIILNDSPRTFDSRKISGVYQWLQGQDLSLYIEIPGWGFIDPFPSAAFQFISEQPVLDDVSTPIPSALLPNGESLTRRLALLATPLCDPQTAPWISNLGFRYVLVQKGRWWWVNYREIESCGWKLVKVFEDKRTDRPLQGTFSDVAVYSPSPKTSIRAIVIPSRDFEEDSNYQILRTSFTADDGSGFLFLRHVKDQMSTVSLQLRVNSNKPVRFEPQSGCQVLDIERKNQVGAIDYIVHVNARCESIRLISTSRSPLTVSNLVAL